MNMQAVDLLLIFDQTIEAPLPPGLNYWITNTNDRIIDNNGDYIVFNVPE